MQQMDAYIALRGSDNIFEMSDVPARHVSRATQAMKPVLDYRVNQTKWVILRWPTPSMAQQAGMSTEAFEDFYFRVCTQNYASMVPGMQALEALMRQTDRVQIKGPKTDLSFSIKSIGAVACGAAQHPRWGSFLLSCQRIGRRVHYFQCAYGLSGRLLLGYFS